MLVKNWMSRNVITIDANESMQEAIYLMRENRVRLLPVTRNGKLVGIVSDGDLKKASASDATTLDVHELLYLVSKIKISDIMTRDPVTIPLDYTIEEAAEILMKNKIPGTPVVDAAGEIVGIITQHDLFEALISLTGLGKRGVQLAFQVKDQPGSIKEVTDIIRAYGGRLASILSSYEDAPEGYRNVYVRAYAIARNSLPQLMEELKDKTTMLYMVDHRENRREIYS